MKKATLGVSKNWEQPPESDAPLPFARGLPQVNSKMDALPIDASVQGTTVLTRGYFHPPSQVTRGAPRRPTANGRDAHRGTSV